MDNQGWIKDYRKEMDSDIWVMPPLYLKVWQYLKYMANHQTSTIPMTDASKEIIERGQHLTSYRTIAKKVAYYENRVYKEPNAKTIKKILEWLEKNNMIKLEHGSGNRQYTKITIVNYELYQCKEEEQVTEKKHESNTKVTPGKQQGNSEETVRKQCVDINKNDKECIKNDKEGKEGKEEQPNSLPPLSFSSSIHKDIFNLVGKEGYRMWFEHAEITEHNDKIIIKAENVLKSGVIKNRYVDRISLHLNKKIEVI